MNIETRIIGVAGGSGSGKTTFAEKILSALGPKAAHIAHDNYYRDQSTKPLEERAIANYDHPDSLETELLIAHLRQLKQGKSVEIPVYDFKEHTRSERKITISPLEFIIVEGILVLDSEELVRLFDFCFFVDTDADVRVVRRLERDMAERGRSFSSVTEQYFATVKPMHEKYVEPSKKRANIIINGEGDTDKALDVLLGWITSLSMRENT